MMHTFQLDREIASRRKTWQSWLDRVVENGPTDTESATALHEASVRYTLLVQMRRSYGDNGADFGYEEPSYTPEYTKEGPKDV